MISSLVQRLRRLLPRPQPINTSHAASPDRNSPLLGTEGWFQRLVEAIPGTLAFSDLNGNLLMVNAHAVKLHGYSSSEQLISEAKTILGLVAPADRERALGQVAAFMQHGEMEPAEFYFVRRDGVTFPAEINATLVRDEDGQPLGILGLARDVTDRKRHQARWIEHTRRLSILGEAAAHISGAASPEDAYTRLATSLQDLTQALLVSVSTYDSTGRTISVRALSDVERYRSLLGLLPSDYSMQNNTYTLSDEAREFVRTGRLHLVPSLHALLLGRVPESMAQAAEQAAGIGRIYSVGLVRGERILGLASILMPQNKDIDFPGIVETLARQSTSLLLRQAAEQSLRESEERFRTLFQEIGDGFILLDDALRVVDCHDTPFGLLGFCTDQVIGQSLDRSFPALVREEPDLMDGLREVLCKGESRTYTRVRYAPAEAAGPVSHLDLMAYLVRLGGQPHVALLCRDVSSRVAMEAQLLLSQGQATLEHLLAGLSHDMGKLLAVARASAELVSAKLPLDSPEQEALASILGSVDQGDLLRRRMVSMSRAESVPFEIIDLHHVIQPLIGLFRTLVGSGVWLDFHPSAQSVFLWGDEGHILRALLNLVDNAHEAMPQGGTLAIETYLQPLEAERAQAWGIPAGFYALLRVRDTGIGVSPDNLVRLFDPFFTTKPRQEHSGLGLSTVDAIVKAHKGHIDVQSALGEGTTFTIYLPAIDTSHLDPEQ